MMVFYKGRREGTCAIMWERGCKGERRELHDYGREKREVVY